MSHQQQSGDRGIPPLERVLGLQQNKSVQFSDTQQQSSHWMTGSASDRAALNGLTIETATAQGFQKSPSSSAGRYGCILWMATAMNGCIL